MTFTFGDSTLRVEGAKADEVEKVSLAVLHKLRPRTKGANPWISGSFYVSIAVVAMAAMLTLGRVLPWYSMPVAIVGAVLITALVGALQLRQDQHVTEVGFLRLMALTLRYLPLLRQLETGRTTKQADEKGSGSEH